MEFKEALRKCRTESELSLNKLSQMTGIPYYSLINWEMGRSKPMLLPCSKLAAAFGITLDEFAVMMEEDVTT